MNRIFKPLAEKAEQLNTYAQPYQHVYDQIADRITFTDLSPCPLCHDDQLVEYIQPHNNPEHGEYSVAINCRQCRIQTQPQHWFISEPTSATRALDAAIENWQQLPRPAVMPTDNPPVMPAAAEASQAKPKNTTVIASAAKQSEPDPVIPAQAGIQKSGVLISFHQYAEWQQSKQDAARYQWLKVRFHAANFYYGEPAICALIFKAPKEIRVSACLDATIDASIKQQAANP